jgi:alpha-mannosidase
LDVLAGLNVETTRAFMDEARNEEGVLQHRDAITGTSPQGTADDYSRRLYSAYTASRAVIEKAYKRLLTKTESNQQIFCDTLNITECTISETSDKIAVTIYNPIGRSLSQYIRVPIVSGNYEVYDPNGEEVTHKVVVPVSKAVTALPERKSHSMNELVFKANLLPLGFVTYLLKKTNTEKSKRKELKFKSLTFV